LPKGDLLIQVWLYLNFRCNLFKSCKLVLIFYTGEAVNNAAGLGFNGYDSNGEPKWDLLNNANIFELEVEYNIE
jgi:lysophospholipid acyltransferase 1/2